MNEDPRERLQSEINNATRDLDIYKDHIVQIGKATEKLRVTPTFYPDTENDEMAGTVRPVSFIFYTLETICHLICWTYHVMAFMLIDLHTYSVDQILLVYSIMVMYYLFLMFTITQSISVCTGSTPSVLLDLFKAIIGFILFMAASFEALWHIESMSYRMQFEDSVSEEIYKHSTTIHPFFKFVKYKSVSCLACSTLYLLHAILLIDVELSHRYRSFSEYELVPIEIYVLGEFIQRILEKWKWFHIFCAVDNFHV